MKSDVMSSVASVASARFFEQTFYIVVFLGSKAYRFILRNHFDSNNGMEFWFFTHLFFVSGCFNVWRCRLDDGKVSNCFLYAVYSATVCVSVSERLCEHCRKEVIYTWHIPLFGLLGVHKFQA